MSASSTTATARSTSRVNRTSARKETATPPTSANARPSSRRWRAMSLIAVSYVASAIARQPAHVTRQPQPQPPLDLVARGRGEAAPKGGTLHGKASLHQLEHLLGTLLHRRAPRANDVVLPERIEEGRHGHREWF